LAAEDQGVIMQFHLNGFEPGDPEIFDQSERYPASGAQGSVPEEVDVLIVGSGPAGLTLAAQLSAFPDIKTCIVEQKSGRMQLGQADGIACRTTEMFHAFGFSERVLKEACWINETTFWKPDDEQPANVVRSGWVQDVEDGLSEFPHVVLNQARVHDFYLDVMRKSAAKLEPHYARRVVAVQPAAGGRDAAAQRVTLRWRAQHRAYGDRARASRRFRQPRLGGHGRAGCHRLPGYSLQVIHPVRQ
jgi:phenol 2-monooxygenase